MLDGLPGTTASSSFLVRRLERERRRADVAAPDRQREMPGIVESGLLLALALQRVLHRPAMVVAVLMDRLAVPVGLVLVAIAYWRDHATLPVRPGSLRPTDGWWAWYDQGKLLEALLAWRHHVESAANQWYQPVAHAQPAVPAR